MRPVLTAGTGGVGNPIASAVEDVVSFVLTVLAVLVPVIAFVTVVVIAVVAYRKVARWRGRRRDRGVAST